MTKRHMLTTKQCGDAIGMSPQYIRCEILDGRLKAIISKPAGRQRAKYRVAPEDFEVYRQTHWKQSA